MGNDRKHLLSKRAVINRGKSGLSHDHVVNNMESHRSVKNVPFKNPMDKHAVQVMKSNKTVSLCLMSSPEQHGIFSHVVERLVLK